MDDVDDLDDPQAVEEQAVEEQAVEGQVVEQAVDGPPRAGPGTEAERVVHDRELVGDQAKQADATSVGAPDGLAISIDASALASCPAGYLCLFHDSGFNGRMLRFQGSGCQNLGPYGFNDETSSWYNRNGATYRIYWDANCRNIRFSAHSGSRSSSMGGWNDEASSICRGAGCP